MSQPNPVCPHCGRSDWPEGPKFNGHKSYCLQNPDKRKPLESKTPPESKTVSDSKTIPTQTTATLTPVTFSFTEGERLPSQQEIPEFKSEEEKAKEEGKPPPTAKATLAEERGAGVSAIAALLLPLFDMWNRFAAGEPAFPTGPEAMKLTKQDAENLAQGIILVDAKHGGAISKAFGSEEYGAELFLAGVSVGIGIKMFMAIRLRQPAKRPPATAGLEKKEERKNPLQPIADFLKGKPKEEKKEEGVVEVAKPMTGDEFQDFAAKRMREMEQAGG